MNDMIEVLKPLAEQRSQGFKLISKSITASEAQSKLRTLEKDLALMQEELAELEAKYGKIEDKL